jgi:glycine cleavage system protein P-like pyridoxal-binding family
VRLPELDVPKVPLPDGCLREDNGMPELSELDVVRHYLRLAQRNFGVDNGFYPLGSCTMKYNPKICEEMARMPGFAEAHPLSPPEHVQGNLALMHRMQTWLAEIGGFTGVSLQPAAGAHGELTALLMIRAYHADRGEHQRNQILIPDTAHGTNPASTTMAGFIAVEIPSDARGNIDVAALRAACTDRVAGVMITNPNTLGLFEEHIEEVIRLVHGCGGLVYGDGANMNALAGIPAPAISASTSCTTTCTRHSPPRMAAADRAPARSRQPGTSWTTCPTRSWRRGPKPARPILTLSWKHRGDRSAASPRSSATSACWCVRMRICACWALRGSRTAPCTRS